MQAPSRLGFDDAIRASIECSICQPDANAGPLPDTFDQTAWIIYVIIQRVREKLYKTNELIDGFFIRNIFLVFYKI